MELRLFWTSKSSYKSPNSHTFYWLLSCPGDTWPWPLDALWFFLCCLLSTPGVGLLSPASHTSLLLFSLSLYISQCFMRKGADTSLTLRKLIFLRRGMLENVFILCSVVGLPNNSRLQHLHSEFWRTALLFPNFQSCFWEVLFLILWMVLGFLSFRILCLCLGFGNFTKICFGLRLSLPSLLEFQSEGSFSSVQCSCNLFFFPLIIPTSLFFCPIWVEFQLAGHWTSCIDLIFLSLFSQCPYWLFPSYFPGVIIFLIYKHFLVCCSFSNSMLFFSHGCIIISYLLKILIIIPLQFSSAPWIACLLWTPFLGVRWFSQMPDNFGSLLM